MVTEELIIDGTAVDMDASTAVTLNFISNLLGDIDAIETSRSQTISLPKTAHNRAVLDDPAGQSHDSTARYVRHTAKYRRNGVEVIPDGYAILLRCADTYEVAIYWGLLTQLQSWLDSDGNIGDLGWKPTLGMKTWEKGNTTPAQYIGRDDMYFWADYGCGVGDRADTEASEQDVALHPFAPVSALLDLICEGAGITGRDLPSDITEQIAKEGVFLTEHILGSDPIDVECTGIILSIYNYSSYYLDFRLSCHSNKYFTIGGYYDYYIRFNFSGTARFEFSLRVTLDDDYDAQSNAALTFISIGGRKTYGEWAGENDIVFSGNYSVDVESYDDGEGKSYGAEIKLTSRPSTRSVSDWEMRITPPGESEPIEIGDVFPCSPNLPDISQVDFLKALCAMHGMFVMQSSDGELTLTTLEALTGNRADAVDWSDRLVESDTPCEPSETALSWGDYAKHNYFKYKEDDTVSTDGDGDLRVYNEALDEEKDIVTLPFSATDETVLHGETKAVIPHYSTNDSGEVQTASVKARIVQFTEGSDGNTIARFSGLRFSRLLPNWSELSALLNSCMAITEEFRLTEHDLLNLDYLKPVYLRQYGRYYGIVSIQTQDDGTCKAELLRLPLEEEEIEEEEE